MADSQLHNQAEADTPARAGPRAVQVLAPAVAKWWVLEAEEAAALQREAAEAAAPAGAHLAERPDPARRRRTR